MRPSRSPLGKPAEVAEYVGVAPHTLENWRWSGRGPRWTKAGRFVRYRWSDVDRWLEQRAQGGDGTAA